MERVGNSPTGSLTPGGAAANQPSHPLPTPAPASPGPSGSGPAAPDAPAPAQAASAAGATAVAPSAGPEPETPAPRRLRWHAGLLLCYLAAGVLTSWPRPSYLAGRLPTTIDQSSYVWDFWWVAHQVVHFGNPWASPAMGAPVGMPLGFDTLMPLPGLLMTPVTVLFGPSASYNLLTILMPGLACYVAYRAARLWLPSELGAIAAGAFYGLATMLVYQDWYHLNIAAGALFLPPAVEAAVRLQRQSRPRHAIALGVVLGASFLVNQESAILAVFSVTPVLVMWLIRSRSAAALRQSLLAVGVTVLVASPQLVAMAWQATSGQASLPSGTLAAGDFGYGVPPRTVFAPSPRLADFGLGPLTTIYTFGRSLEGVPTFGITLTALAIVGLVAGWRRRGTRLLAVGWLGSVWLALGPALRLGHTPLIPLAVSWHGYRMSAIMPYTWLVHIPGLAGFREADRFTLLGLLPAALLAGYAVNWLRGQGRAVVAVALVAAALELGYSGDRHIHSMPTATPTVDSAIVADHSGSIVVDIPYGIHGGVGGLGPRPSPHALVMATADGHPRAVSDSSWVPTKTQAAISSHPFYRYLVAAQEGLPVTAAQVSAATRDARQMGVGWAVEWSHAGNAESYLQAVGFRFGYRSGQVQVLQLAR